MKILILTICIFVYFGCSNADFKGNGKFKIGSNTNSSDSPDSTSESGAKNDGDEDLGGEEDGNKDTSSLEFGSDGMVKDGEELSVYTENGELKFDPCTSVTENGGLIDFENAGHDNQDINDQYWKKLGVKFSTSTTDSPKLAMVGGPLTAFGCNRCATVADSVLEPEKVGDYFLTDDGLSSRKDGNSNLTIIIDYRESSAELSFDLLDLDASESWNILSFDKDGNEIGKKIVDSDVIGANDGGVETVIITSETRNIKQLRIEPITEGQNRNVGVAFDNFSPHGKCERN